MLAFFLGLGYIFVDVRYLGRGMSMGERERVALEAEITELDCKSRLISRYFISSDTFNLCSKPLDSEDRQEVSDLDAACASCRHGHVCLGETL